MRGKRRIRILDDIVLPGSEDGHLMAQGTGKTFCGLPVPDALAVESDRELFSLCGRCTEIMVSIADNE